MSENDHDVDEALACVEANLDQFEEEDLITLKQYITTELATREETPKTNKCFQCRKQISIPDNYCDGYCLTAFNSDKENKRVTSRG